jgi:hypothetical protein
MTRYAAYDWDGIFGTGATPEEALADTVREGDLSEEEKIDLLDGLKTAPMTKRLAGYIAAHGFDASYDCFRVLDDGLLDLPATVQMINARKAEDGYIEYHGPSEDAEAWLQELDGYAVTSLGSVTGWDEYTHQVRLAGDNSILHYLVPEPIYHRIHFDEEA